MLARIDVLESPIVLPARFCRDVRQELAQIDDSQSPIGSVTVGRFRAFEAELNVQVPPPAKIHLIVHALADGFEAGGLDDDVVRLIRVEFDVKKLEAP